MGPVLPPSPQLPQPVSDLKAVQRGDQIEVSFSTPARTTDNLPVKQFSEVELRIGPATIPFDIAQWADSATVYEIEPPPAGDPENPVVIAVTKKIPAGSWAGKRIAVAARTAVRKNDHYSQWSNRVVLNVVPPLTPPMLKAQSTAEGVLLTWPAQGEGLQYRVYRKASADTNQLELGTVKIAQFLDASAQYDTPYEYTAVTVKGQAESLPSQSVPVKMRDIFPPSVPAGVTVLAAPNSVEVSWQRSPEADLKGYHVFRSVDGGPYEPVGPLLTVPAFSDANVQHGKLYRYAVSSVDQHDNASERSKPVEVSY